MVTKPQSNHKRLIKRFVTNLVCNLKAWINLYAFNIIIDLFKVFKINSKTYLFRGDYPFATRLVIPRLHWMKLRSTKPSEFRLWFYFAITRIAMKGRSFSSILFRFNLKFSRQKYIKILPKICRKIFTEKDK